MEFTVYGNRVEIKREGHEKEIMQVQDPLEVLDKEIQAFRPVPIDGLLKFFCCAVGYIGYDTIRYCEQLPNIPPMICHLQIFR